MRLLKQSTARTVSVFMTDSADHVTGKTGLTLTITASKAGAAFASISPSVTERGNGWYALDLTTSHTDTLGDMALHITSSGADPSDLLFQVVAFDPGDATALGLSRLDATVGSRATQTSLDTLDDYVDTEVSAIKTKTDQLTFTVANRVDATVPGSVTVSVTSPLASDGTLTLVPGDDYFAADSRSLDFTFSGVPVLTGATVALAIRYPGHSATTVSITGSVLSATQLRFEPTSAQTLLLSPDTQYDYQVQAILSGTSHVTTLQEGTVTTLLNLATP